MNIATIMKNSQNKEEKIKKWLNNKYNLIFLAILILSIFIGLYYFNLTKSQPLWWDEADYMAYAKNLAGANVDWVVTEKHHSLFPFIVSLFFIIGFSESLTKFFVEFLPYITLIVLTFLTARAMYKDKRIALITTFLTATTWTILFNAMRFHIGIPALVFGMMSIYVFWQGYEKNHKIFGKIPYQWAIPLAVILVTVTYSIRRGYFLFGLFFIIYMFLSRDFKSLIKDKYNWIGLIIAATLLLVIESTLYSSGVSELSSSTGFLHTGVNLFSLQIFSAFFSYLGTEWASILLYLFWIGLAIITFNLALSFGHIKKMNNSQTKADLFILITIITTLAFFMFFLRMSGTFGEPRWYFPLLFGALICISKSTIFLSNLFLKNNKQLITIFIIVLIGFGGYYGIQHADIIITSRVNSFQGIKDAGLYLSENSNQEDLILTLGQPQVEYYSERKTIHAREWVEEAPDSNTHFEKSIEELQNNPNIKYLIISFSEQGYPKWMKIQTTTSWEIPFMDTKIDFVNQIQDIKQEKTFDNLKFTLIDIKQDVFIYHIDRI